MIKILTGFQVLSEIIEILKNGKTVTCIHMGDTSIKVKELSMDTGAIDERRTSSQTIYIATNTQSAEKLNQMATINGLIPCEGPRSWKDDNVYEISDVCIRINVRDQYLFDYKNDEIKFDLIKLSSTQLSSAQNRDEQVKNAVTLGEAYSDIANKFGIRLEDVYKIIGKDKFL